MTMSVGEYFLMQFGLMAAGLFLIMFKRFRMGAAIYVFAFLMNIACLCFVFGRVNETATKVEEYPIEHVTVNDVVYPVVIYKDQLQPLSNFVSTAKDGKTLKVIDHEVGYLIKLPGFVKCEIIP